MKKEIAFFVDKNNQIAEVVDSGFIKIYNKSQGQWKTIKEIPFQVNRSKGIISVRQSFDHLVDILGECKLFAAKKLTGLIYTTLETSGFNLWELEGEPEAFLDVILEKEEEAILEEKAQQEQLINLSPRKKDQDGYYYVNLIDLQNSSSGLTSKQVLLPFFKNITFYELEMICNHVPKWFENQFETLKLQMDAESLSDGTQRLLISKKVCS